MGEKIAEWIEKLATGKKARMFWAMVIVLLVILIISFPFIDSTFLFYNRVETRIDNLEKLVSISGMSVSDNPALNAEYQDILNDMESARNNSAIAFTFDVQTRTDTIIKFLSGAVIGVIIIFAGFFNKNPNGRITLRFFITNNLPIALVGAILAIVLGYLSTFIPTLGSPLVNAIGNPIVQFIFLDLLLSSPKKTQGP